MLSKQPSYGGFASRWEASELTRCAFSAHPRSLTPCAAINRLISGTARKASPSRSAMSGGHTHEVGPSDALSREGDKCLKGLLGQSTVALSSKADHRQGFERLLGDTSADGRATSSSSVRERA